MFICNEEPKQHPWPLHFQRSMKWRCLHRSEALNCCALSTIFSFCIVSRVCSFATLKVKFHTIHCIKLVQKFELSVNSYEPNTNPFIRRYSISIFSLPSVSITTLLTVAKEQLDPDDVDVWISSAGSSLQSSNPTSNIELLSGEMY